MIDRLAGAVACTRAGTGRAEGDQELHGMAKALDTDCCCVGEGEVRQTAHPDHGFGRPVRSCVA